MNMRTNYVSCFTYACFTAQAGKGKGRRAARQLTGISSAQPQGSQPASEKEEVSGMFFSLTPLKLILDLIVFMGWRLR